MQKQRPQQWCQQEEEVVPRAQRLDCEVHTHLMLCPHVGWAPCAPMHEQVGRLRLLGPVA